MVSAHKAFNVHWASVCSQAIDPMLAYVCQVCRAKKHLDAKVQSIIFLLKYILNAHKTLVIVYCVLQILLAFPYENTHFRFDMQ